MESGNGDGSFFWIRCIEWRKLQLVRLARKEALLMAKMVNGNNWLTWSDHGQNIKAAPKVIRANRPYNLLPICLSVLVAVSVSLAACFPLSLLSLSFHALGQVVRLSRCVCPIGQQQHIVAFNAFDQVRRLIVFLFVQMHYSIYCHFL